MILYLFQGAVLALQAAITPGPFQAFLLTRALNYGWKRTLPASFAPLISDGPIIALVLFVLTQTPQWFLDILRIAGGLFILYLAMGVFKAARNPIAVEEAAENAARRSLISAIILNLLNPNPYIFWGVIGGPIALTGWREAPVLGAIFVVGFYGVFVCTLAALIIVFASAGKLDSRVHRTLGGVAGIALIGFGLYQIWSGTMALT